jgi:nucleoside-triphosphatase
MPSPGKRSRKRILITGLPGVGKTTLIRKVAAALQTLHPVGFYTEEIREKGVRKGFAMVNLDGTRGVLAHVDIKGRFRVGKYGVDIAAFESFLEKIDFFAPEPRLIVIDEVGKMECFSEFFQKLVQQVWDSDKALVATIARKGGGMIEQLKRRPDATLLEVTVANRDRILTEILKLFSG